MNNESMLKIAICDDEQPIRDYLKKLTEKCTDAQVHVFANGEELLSDPTVYDIILLDISLNRKPDSGKPNGMEVAKKIRETSDVIIIFVTALKEYVFEGYEVQAVRYLLKPMQQEKVFELLDLARQNLQEQPSLILNCADEKKKLYLSQIAAIEAQGHYLIFHTTAGQLQQKASLSSLAGHLGDSFVMSHRSFYVNLAHLLRISRTECTLDTGLTVPVSRGAYKNLNEQFIRYYRKEMLE